MLSSRSYLMVLLICLASLLALGKYFDRSLDNLRNFVFDTYQRVNPHIADPKMPIRIIDIDDESIAKLGQWPWPRTLMAEIVGKLKAADAAAIAFDIVFSESDRTSPETMLNVVPDPVLRQRLQGELSAYVSHDKQFADQILNAGVILATTLTPEGSVQMPLSKAGFASAGDPPESFLPNFKSGIAPLPILIDAADGLGATNWLPDRDQVVRSVPLLINSPTGMMPSLVLETLRIAEGAGSIIIRASNASGHTAFGSQTGINTVKVGTIEIPTGPRGEVRVRFSNSEKSRFLPASKLLSGDFDRDSIKGRIVLIGSSAAGLSDLRATPLEAAIPGVEVHAQILEHILSGKNFYRPDWLLGAEWILSILLIVGVWACLAFTSVLNGAIAGGVIALAISSASYWLFLSRGLHIDPTLPILSGLGTYILSSATLWQFERTTRSNLRNAFGKFLAPKVIERLVENPERLVLGGETRDMTIMFSDLRNFTAISEGFDARQLTTFMNAYLSPMTDIILHSGGTVDKYIGDAIVAFWNAPLDDADHPQNAVSSALKMRDALSELNRQRNTNGYPFLQFGVGLNSGPCSVGNMGSIQRFDYSVLGDTVNLASRIEGLSKHFGVDILASKALKERTENAAWLSVGGVRVKGKKQVTELFMLCGNEAYAAEPEFQHWKAQHEEMLVHYYSGNLRIALSACEELQKTMPSLKQELYTVMIARLTKLSQLQLIETFDPIQTF